MFYVKFNSEHQMYRRVAATSYFMNTKHGDIAVECSPQTRHSVTRFLPAKELRADAIIVRDAPRVW